VVGPNDVAQLQPVIGALEIELDPDDHARIGALFA
jgi:aryl-alcohol dehydrogenase-like predicted oxidoreductase